MKLLLYQHFEIYYNIKEVQNYIQYRTLEVFNILKQKLRNYSIDL